jgi:hypothetical protein
MKRAKMSTILVLVLLVEVLACPEVLARIVGAADVMDCVNEDGLTCYNKKVVTVAVSYGLSTRLDAVTDGTDDAALEIQKTAPVLKYPLKYLHTVSYYPYENVVKVVDPNTDYSGCIACPNSLCPTCGWQKDDANNPIEDSQGFCSYKTLGEPTCSSWRAEELLGEHSSDVNRFSTAHCLREGELYFHGYEIGRYAKTYTIYVKVTYAEDVWVGELRPDSPVFSYTNYTYQWALRGTLLGDFTETRGVPELDNYILYIPAFPTDHPYVQQYQHYMLLVPREELSKDGSEFDKVGIDFYKFRMMGAAASVTDAGDGLHNQLYQKHQADMQQLVTNPELDSTYLVSGKKPFKDSMDFQSGMDKVLEYKITDIEYSQVQLTMDAVSLKYIENESLCHIVSAQVRTFDSMSNNGVLEVLVEHDGNKKANYIVTVSDMSMKLLDAVPAKAITLGIANQELLTFDIHTVEDMNSTHLLNVRLKSPTGRLYDEMEVNFDTTKHDTKYPRDLQMKNEGSQVSAPAAPPPGDITCDNKVDYDDLRVLALSWLEDGSFSDLAAWPYCDNVINYYDFSVLAGSWKEGSM